MSRKLRMALHPKKLTRVHEAIVRDARLHDAILDIEAASLLNLSTDVTAALLATREDDDANG